MHEAPPSRGSPRPLNAGIAHTRDSAMPALEGIDGCVGLSLLVDPNVRPLHCYQLLGIRGGRCAQARRPFGRFVTGPPSFWVVTGRSRNGRSLPCIASTARVRAPGSEPRGVKVGPDQIDRGIDFYKMTILPALEELEGFCSASLLVDRASGRAWPRRPSTASKAMERNKDQLDTIRATGQPGSKRQRVLDQCDFELAVAHLRVPEMV